jgi:CBS domain-containing protein
MKLCDLFTKDVVTADPGETLATVARRMSERNVGAVVRVEDRRPVGMVTDRDLAIALGARGLSPQTQVQKVMTPHVLAVLEDAGIFTATTYLRERGVRRLPIVDREDRLVGIATLDDLLRCLARELYNLAESITGEMQVTKPAPSKPGG